jgi:hypothetical protein
MDETILARYCRCADFWPALGHVEAPQPQLRAAAVSTTAFVARRFFRGTFDAARPLGRAPW